MMRKKELLIIGTITASIIGAVTVVVTITRKHQKLLKKVLFGIEDEVDEIEEWCDEINNSVNDVSETLDAIFENIVEMRNHTDDISSCAIEIKDCIIRSTEKDSIDDDKEPSHWTLASPRSENVSNELNSPAGPM